MSDTTLLDKLITATAQAREATQELHRAVKDAKAVVKEMRGLREETINDAHGKVVAAIDEQLNAFQEASRKAVEEVTQRINDTVDRKLEPIFSLLDELNDRYKSLLDAQRTLEEMGQPGGIMRVEIPEKEEIWAVDWSKVERRKGKE